MAAFELVTLFAENRRLWVSGYRTPPARCYGCTIFPCSLAHIGFLILLPQHVLNTCILFPEQLKSHCRLGW